MIFGLVETAMAHHALAVKDPQTAATRYFDRNGVRGIFEVEAVPSPWKQLLTLPSQFQGLVRELYVTKPADPLAAMIEMIDAGRV
eukprot:m.123973 g.123973  ORF g.123973 m.123973 type:complete len:85 (-) comp9661_c0_seq12:193-447(-)